MLKKILLTSAFSIILSIALLIIYLTIEKINSKKITAKKVSELTSTNLLSLDSSEFNIPNNKKVVLIFFDSECEHCQYEAIEVSKNLDRFKNGALIFISSEPIKSIRSFSEQYRLNTQPFIYFIKINRELVFSTFGNVSIPHIFIYNEDRKLIREYKGETKVEAILKYIQ